MEKIFRNVGNEVSIETCIAYYALGFDSVWTDGKDLTLVEQKNDLPSGNLERPTIKNNLNKSISEKSSADKTNYSAVCLSCGRKLRSEASRARGYGSSCYRKLKKIEKQSEIEEVEVIEELEGQIFIDELRRAN